jgi:hypothetical protein
MPALTYLCVDVIVLIFNSCLSVCFSWFVLFKFKDQFLFLLCLPYLSRIPGSAFLVTNFESIFQFYSLLALSTFFLMAPVLCFIALFFLLLPTIDLLSALLTLLLYAICLLSLMHLLHFVFGFVIPSMFLLLGTFATTHYALLSVVVDLAIDSWLRFVLAVAVLVPFTFTLYTVLVAILYYVPLANLFFIRLALLVLVVSVVTLFIPYEPVIHLVCVLFLLSLVEFPFVLRFVCFSYSGRVA